MFNSEKELQEYCCEVLSYRGIEYSSEVEILGGIGRADIVTPDAVIELKKTLTRDSINSAVGQALAYNAALQRPKVIVMGCKPVAEGTLEAALTTIQLQTQSHPNLYIVFWEDQSFWHLPQPEPQYQDPSRYSYSPSYNYDFPWGLVVTAIVVAVVGAAGISLLVSSGNTKSRDGEDRKVTKTEVEHYAQIGRLASGNGIQKNQDKIAQHYHQIANVTQITCVKNFAQEMKASAEQSTLFKNNRDIFDKYMTGGCEPLKVLEDRTGYRPVNTETQASKENSQLVRQQVPPRQPKLKNEATVHTTRPGKNAANLRLSPNGAIVGTPIMNGTRVQVLEQVDGWTKVQINGRTGWVFSESLK